VDWPEIGWVDAVMLAVVVVSALLGAMRGLTLEVLSLAGWVVAWFAGLRLGPSLAPYLPIGSMGSALNGVAAFASAFVLVLVLWGLVARIVSALIGRTLLRPLDRGLGALFGLVRGVVVLLAVATLFTFTPLGTAPARRDSAGAVWLNAMLRALVPLVSPGPAERPGLRSV
jgi:membrane protein required for colicin V production